MKAAMMKMRCQRQRPSRTPQLILVSVLLLLPFAVLLPAYGPLTPPAAADDGPCTTYCVDVPLDGSRGSTPGGSGGSRGGPEPLSACAADDQGCRREQTMRETICGIVAAIGQPCEDPAPPPIPVDVAGEAATLCASVALPEIVLRANPRLGLVNVPT